MVTKPTCETSSSTTTIRFKVRKEIAKESLMIMSKLQDVTGRTNVNRDLGENVQDHAKVGIPKPSKLALLSVVLTSVHFLVQLLHACTHVREFGYMTVGNDDGDLVFVYIELPVIAAPFNCPTTRLESHSSRTSIGSLSSGRLTRFW